MPVPMRANTGPGSLLRQSEAADPVRPSEPDAALPSAFLAWFQRRGWRPRAHQLALLQKAAERRSTLLIAPTGAGKTLAGFLPSLVALSRPDRARERLIHTLYISPLKALAADVEPDEAHLRLCAVIAGLIERRHPGKAKSGRQVTISSDLIYDVLRKHDAGHVLLEAAWADAATGLLDIRRLGDFLRRIKGRIRYQAATHVTPLAVPVLLEIGQELAYGGGVADAILREAADDLVREAMQRG